MKMICFYLLKTFTELQSVGDRANKDFAPNDKKKRKVHTFINFVLYRGKVQRKLQNEFYSVV